MGDGGDGKFICLSITQASTFPGGWEAVGNIAHLHVLTLTLASLRNSSQQILHSRNHLVVHVQQWPAALREAAVVQQQPVQQQQSLSEQRCSWAEPPGRRRIRACRKTKPPGKGLFLPSCSNWNMDKPGEVLCCWESERLNHCRWKTMTMVWTIWDRTREQTLLARGRKQLVWLRERVVPQSGTGTGAACWGCPLASGSSFCSANAPPDTHKTADRVSPSTNI